MKASVKYKVIYRHSEKYSISVRKSQYIYEYIRKIKIIYCEHKKRGDIGCL